MAEPIVAVGLLCRTQLERLSVALADGIPIPDGNPFGDLLEKLDQIEAKRLGAAAVSPLLLP